MDRNLNNWKEWRDKNKDLYDKKYHLIKRSERQKKLKKIANEMCKSLIAGFRFLGINFNPDIDYIFKLFASFGIRKLNKLCPDFSP